MTVGLAEGVKFALLNPAETIEILFKEVPELKLASTAKEQLEIGMGVWAANYVSKEAMDKGVGYADPGGLRQDDRPDLRERSGAAGDKKPDPRIALHQRVRRQAEAQRRRMGEGQGGSAKYALG